ncbi:hypothetical protein NW768_010243 [Fusarium equiseti]|uniref:Uncharacterized protein n=1 Tax=Fusarium equiseti TaxID=61235 RepID=A0ABQ8R104_FUSEQ|nr:hypothetical protein NW768_010243 [Fusarium equiseti]
MVNKIYFGVGAKAPDGEVVPVQTYPARPQVYAHVFSKPKYYIALGNYEPGSIVDATTLGEVLLVDFYGSPGHNATFTLNESNGYNAADNVNASGIKWRVGEKY